MILPGRKNKSFFMRKNGENDTIIEPSRLILREMNMDDCDALYAVLADSDITQLYLYKRYTMRTYQSNEEVTFTSATSFSTCS